MKGLVLGLVLITQTCYSIEYLDGGTSILQERNSAEINQACYRDAAALFALTCIALGAFYITQRQKNKTKIMTQELHPPLPKTLSKEELERIKARLYMTTDERIQSMKRID